jgi:hypothetical protein
MRDDFCLSIESNFFHSPHGLYGHRLETVMVVARCYAKPTAQEIQNYAYIAHSMEIIQLVDKNKKKKTVQLIYIRKAYF